MGYSEVDNNALYHHSASQMGTVALGRCPQPTKHAAALAHYWWWFFFGGGTAGGGANGSAGYNWTLYIHSAASSLSKGNTCFIIAIVGRMGAAGIRGKGADCVGGRRGQLLLLNFTTTDFFANTQTSKEDSYMPS